MRKFRFFSSPNFIFTYSLIFFSMKLSTIALADVTDAIVVGATAGAVTGTVAAQDNDNASSRTRFPIDFSKYRLSGWEDLGTGLAQRFSSTCELQAEIHLLGSSSRNFIHVFVSNSVKGTKTVNLGQTEIKFAGGRERLVDVDPSEFRVELKTNSFVTAQMPLPAKADFESQDQLKIRIPIIAAESNEKCWIEADFARDLSRPVDRDTFITADMGQYFFNLGQSFKRSGNLQSFGEKGGFFSFGFSYFGSDNWGGGMNVNIEGMDNKFTLIELPVSVIRRWQFNDSINFQYRLGISFYGIIRDTDVDPAQQQRSHGVGPNHALSLQFRLSRASSHSRFFLGPSLEHSWIPFGDILGAKSTGHDIRGILQVGIGI